MAASVSAILATGLIISTVSFTGLTINSIDQMEMQEFGRANALYVDTYIASVRQADEIVVAVETGYNQVLASVECERGSSCVSRRGNGGEGQTYFALNGVAVQIGSVHQSLVEGEVARDDALETLADSNAEIQTALNAATGSRKARRARVQKLFSIQRTSLADLDRALPLSVVAGLADTLETGVTMPNDRDLAQRINAQLTPAGKGISQALDTLEIMKLERPDMPPETGVMRALSWIGFYLPLFLMLVLIDTLFPLLLWFFAYSSLRPLVEPEEDEDDIDPFSMTGVLDTPPVLIGPAARQSLSGTPSKGNS